VSRKTLGHMVHPPLRIDCDVLQAFTSSGATCTKSSFPSLFCHTVLLYSYHVNSVSCGSKSCIIWSTWHSLSKKIWLACFLIWTIQNSINS